MSGQSIFKPIYDGYAVDFFRNRGWQSYVVRKSRWYCDVIAVRTTEVAIIEVKSIAERSTGPNHDDMSNLAPILLPQFPPGFGGRRREILQEIPSTRGIRVSLIKLYAVSIGCQLYRYFKEFKHKRQLYASTIQSIQIPPAGQFTLKAFLAVPIEAKIQCQNSTTFLRSKGIINSTAEDEDNRLFCTEICYA
jgi:hypothetical protein